MQFDGAHHKLDITEICIEDKCNHGVNSFQNADATTTQYQQNNQPTESVKHEKWYTIRRERLKLKTDGVVKGKISLIFLTVPINFRFVRKSCLLQEKNCMNFTIL